MPALQHAAPAISAERPQPVASPRPLGMLTNAVGRASKGLGLPGAALGDSDSPINGLLYVSGNITGSRAHPTGEVAVRLYDAAVGALRGMPGACQGRLGGRSGVRRMWWSACVHACSYVGARMGGACQHDSLTPRQGALDGCRALYQAALPHPSCSGQTRLSQAQASARLSEARQLSFNVEVVPAEGHRQAGYVRAGGMVPLAEAALGGSSGGKDSAQQQQQQMDVRLSVKDGGMALLTSVTPDLRWQGGLAVVDVRLRGPMDQPVLSGSASISRATLDCPLLRFPLTNVSTEVRAGGGMVMVDSLEARCGRRGHLKARGALPVYGSASGGSSKSLPVQQQHGQNKLVAEASGLELRVRNLYSGQYDATVSVTDSLARPTVAGGMRFSRGIVFMVPQGAAGELAVCPANDRPNIDAAYALPP